MANNLPAKSRSKGIMPAHKRRLITKTGVKTVVVNKGVAKTPSKAVTEKKKPQRYVTTTIKPKTKVRNLALASNGERKIKLRWQDKEKPALPGKKPEFIDYDTLNNELSYGPSRNVSDFYDMYLAPEISAINNDIQTWVLKTDEEVSQRIREVTDYLDKILVSGSKENPILAGIRYEHKNMVYYEDGYGEIAEFTEENTNGIDIEQGGDGFYRITLPLDSNFVQLRNNNEIISNTKDWSRRERANNDLMTELESKKIIFAKVFFTKRQIGSPHYQILVEKEGLKQVKAIKQEIKKKYYP